MILSLWRCSDYDYLSSQHHNIYRHALQTASGPISPFEPTVAFFTHQQKLLSTHLIHGANTSLCYAKSLFRGGKAGILLERNEH